MTKRTLSVFALTGSLILAIPAWAGNPHYEERALGQIIVESNRADVSRDEIFAALDSDQDGTLTKAEMFQKGASASNAFPQKKTRGNTNFTTREGRKGGVDYYSDHDGQSKPLPDFVIVTVEDATGDGSFFTSMDSNNDGLVTRAEFRTEITQDAAANTIAPAAAE